MLTEQIKCHLKHRLCTLYKFTLTVFFYWDETQNKFVARKCYSWYYIRTLHFGGYLTCLTIGIQSHFLLNTVIFPDEVAQTKNEYNRHLLTLLYVMNLFMIYITIMCASSSELSHLSDVISSFNQGFHMNEILKNIFFSKYVITPRSKSKFSK